MTDLRFLPWEPPAPFCTIAAHGCSGYWKSIPIAKALRLYAAAFWTWDECWECEMGIDELEIGIAPACALDRGDFLCDRLHTAEEIARIRLSRGREPWRADIHFDVRDVYYESDKYGLWLPWLQFHYFGPFDWPHEDMKERMTHLANTVIPYLCDHALIINEYAWPLRKPHGGS